MIYKKRFALLLAVLILLPMLSGCEAAETPAPASTQPLSKSAFLLGTYVDISLFDKLDEKIIDKAFDRIAEIEAKMTINNAETSEIIKLNEASGTGAVKLSPDTYLVVERGKYYSELTEGKFDITVGSIVKLWNIGTDYAAVPEDKVIRDTVKLVDYQKLQLKAADHSAMLQEAGMKVDLGAIAKGYAADEAGRILREEGVKHAIINLGGNVLTVGGNPNGNQWKIGIQDPFNPRGDYLGIVPSQDKTVVTSGTYERYFEQNGKKYHHILNPETGYPVENNLHSVSIVTEKSIDGDGLSTTCLLLGVEEGMKLIEKLDHVEAIFVTGDKKVYVSSGLKDIFLQTSSDFTIVN